MTSTQARDDAERELLELLRGEDIDDFILTVSLKAGHWITAIKIPTQPEAGMGEGSSFAESWHNLEPWFAD